MMVCKTSVGSHGEVGESPQHLQQDGREVESRWVRLDVIEECKQAQNPVSPEPVQRAVMSTKWLIISVVESPRPVLQDLIRVSPTRKRGRFPTTGRTPLKSRIVLLELVTKPVVQLVQLLISVGFLHGIPSAGSCKCAGRRKPNWKLESKSTSCL